MMLIMMLMKPISKSLIYIVSYVQYSTGLSTDPHPLPLPLYSTVYWCRILVRYTWSLPSVLPNILPRSSLFTKLALPLFLLLKRSLISGELEDHWIFQNNVNKLTTLNIQVGDLLCCIVWRNKQQLPPPPPLPLFSSMPIITRFQSLFQLSITILFWLHIIYCVWVSICACIP